MDRRKFLKTGACGALATGRLRKAGVETTAQRALSSQSIIGERNIINFSADEQRQRLKNIAVCESAIHSCLRKHCVRDYLPGQCSYNLGEYPCRAPWEITDYDEAELDRLKSSGIGLIQLHEEWNDSQRLYGATKFTPLNPAGFRRFLDLAHARAMKVIVYASTGFFERRDPDFRPEWARDQDLVELFYHYARCSPASPGWRGYVLDKICRLMNDYPVDGIYNDLGYLPLAGNKKFPTKDEVFAFEESSVSDGALSDLLGELYAEIHRRGGLVKIHQGGTDKPHTDTAIYDYLWVGEEIESGDALREAVKDYRPYVIPCLDMSRARIADEDELYLHSVPYMQFPLLLAGKPFTGERGAIPGIRYAPEKEDFWTQHCREIWKFYRANTNGPFSYGWWDSVPGRATAHQVHARWLNLYRQMVEEGTWVWIQIGQSTLFRGDLPASVVASAFANRDLYLVLANYGKAAVAVETTRSYVPMEEPAIPAKQWILPPRKLTILRAANNIL